MNKYVVQTYLWGDFIMRKDQNNISLAKDAVIGSAIALGIILVVFLIFSMLIASGRIGSGIMGFLAVGTIFAASLIGSIVSIKKHKGKALLVGLCEGVILYLITLIIGAFWPSESLIGGYTPAIILASLLGGSVASILCARPKKVKL